MTLERLRERAGGLSNHMRRYIRAVEATQAEVVSRLEDRGHLGRISFGDPSPDLHGEMGVIVASAEGSDQQLRFLAFYYALQYIIMEIHSLDILKYNLIQDGGRPEVAWDRCITYAQSRFQELTSSYLEVVCRILMPEHLEGGFVLFGVGTMGDRDDIDVAAVDALEADRRHGLSHALSRLAQVMLRTSCTLHFHMAEALGGELLSDSVEGYLRALDGRPYSAVVISQLLAAERLVGEPQLAADFTRRVPSRFYFHPGQPGHDHEGFLRAMLGELKELVQRPVSAHYISPKDDGLRLIKGYLALAKSIHHVPSHGWHEVLAYLRLRSPRTADEYATVGHALVFLETVRYLHQLLIVEEEEIATDDLGGDGPLRTVAEHMGFVRRAALSPQVPFLTAYYEVTEQLKRVVGRLLEPMIDHLGQITTLSVFHFDPTRHSDLGNLALRHASQARRFLATRYWDDLLDEFALPDSAGADRYVRDLAMLTPFRRRVVLRTLVEWGVRDAASFGRFLILLRDRVKEIGDEGLIFELVDLYLARCRDEPRIAGRLALLFARWPAEVNRFLTILDPERLRALQELAAREVHREELAEAGQALVHLLELHRVADRAFMGEVRRAVRRHPHALLLLREPGELRVLADTLYGQAERFSDLFSRREWLEAYYHLEIARLGLQFLAGQPYHRLMRQFRQSLHILLRSIYFLCRKELYALYRMEWSKRHSIGVYLEAGCLGFHPFDPRLNLAVLLFQEDDEMARFFGEVVASFQEELVRLGIEPRAYAPRDDTQLQPRPLAEQLELLESSPEVAGDPLERLGPLRLSRIVGTHGHLDRFVREVTQPLLAPIRNQLGQLLAEHLSATARRVVPFGDGEAIDPRSMPGGVSDLERFYLYICAMRGDVTLCEDRPACLPDGLDPAPELAYLGRSTAQLQVLVTLRRLLRCDLAPGQVDAEFIARYAWLLRRHPEVPEELMRDPGRHLETLARRNVELMQQYLARTCPDSS